jgi:hypothetical protein
METRLNPIEQRMAAGMSAIAAYLTEATCGEACWQAREDICRCSCGGKNHGCMRSADGTRPTRTAKISGVRYELAAVGGRELYDRAKAVNQANGPYRVEEIKQDGKVIHTYRYWWHETDNGAPARLKPATKDQVAKWPELASARAEIEALKAAGNCAAVYMRPWPYLLWVRCDFNPATEAAPTVAA